MKSSVSRSYRYAFPALQMLYLPAQFTAEAALLFALLIPMLVALIIAGFYIHDRAFLRGASCELASMAVNLRLYDDAQANMQERLSLRKTHSVCWADQITGSVSADGEARASFSGNFPVPGIAAQLLGADKLSLHSVWTIRLFEPAALIRKIRGARYLLDRIWEE